MAIAQLLEPFWHSRQREIARLAARDLRPVERCRDRRVGCRPHRIGGRDGPVLRVLVVVDEHAVAFLLPPLARRELRRATLHLTRESKGCTPHLIETRLPVDANVDMHAALARRLGPADEPELLQRGARHARDLAHLW